MAFKVGSNIFTGGLNTDSDINTQPNNTYRDAVNIDTVDNGAFSALNNVRGTSDIGTLTKFAGTKEINILGQFEASGLFSGVEKPCIVYYAKIGDDSRIYILDTQDNKVSILFDENNGNLEFPSEGTVDAYYNKQKGENIQYFVDFENDFRKITLDDSITNTLEDLILRPVSGSDLLTFNSLQDGGQLAAGSYQFAYRYTKVGTFLVSGWSSPINPIPVIPKELSAVTDPDQVVGGTVGSTTGKAIKLSLALTVANADRFDAVQIAVIRNTTGSLTSEITALILATSKDNYNDPANILYTGGEGGESVGIEEIVVEDAPLKTAKTIEQKDNRLILGNIKLNNLTIEDGQSTFRSAKTVARGLPNAYKEVDETYNDKGYFREELYRFARVYTDKFGNSSPPLPFDFNFRRRYLQDDSFVAASIVSVIINTAASGTVISSTIAISGNHSASLLQHDWISRSAVASISGAATDRFKIISGGVFSSPNTTVVVAGDFNTASGSFFIRLIGDEGNCIGDNSTSTDWKFPERSVNKYSLLNNNDQAVVLGIRIDGITNHPEYAVSMKIVRLPREKNILFQTPHIPSVVYQGVSSPGKNPDTNNDHNGPFIQLGQCGRVTESRSSSNEQARIGSSVSIGQIGSFKPGGTNNLDFIGPKLFRLGAAKNLVRFARRGWVDGTESDGIYSSTTVCTPAWATAMKEAGTVKFNGTIDYLTGDSSDDVNIVNVTPQGFDNFRSICPIMFAVPPEYVFNNAGDPFNEYSFSPSQQAHIVDAVSFATIVKVNEDEFPDQLGFVNSASLTRATIYQAISHEYYFYNRDGLGVLEGLDQFYYTKITDTAPFTLGAAKEFIRLKNAVTQPLNSAPTVLTESPYLGNALFDYILKWGNGLGLSQDQGDKTPIINATDPVSTLFGNPVENQRGIIMVLEEPLEDLTVRVGSEFIDGRALFPLISSGISLDIYKNMYDEVFLSLPLAWLDDKLINKNNDSPMANSTSTARSVGEADPDGKLAGSAYVINIESGLGDDRYGSTDASQKYISTGAEIPITSTSQVVDVVVYGGDCFVTKQVFKINNSAARPIRFVGPDNDAAADIDYDQQPNGTDVGTQVGEFKTGSNFDDVEILEMYIESEVNGAYSAETGVYPEVKSTSISTYNADFLYPYHFNYSQENDVKTYFSRDRSIPFTDHFPARLSYTDQKVDNSNIEGFNRFRELSVKDLEEQYGDITKLIKTSDSELWSVQEKAVRWVPIGKEEITLDSGNSLGTVGADVVIGNTIRYLSTTSGSQHMRTVKSKGGLVFYVDAEKREVNAFGSMGEVKAISELGNYTLFKDLLTRSKEIPEHKLMGGYDFNKKEYWIVYNSWTDSVPDGTGDNINKSRGGVNIIFNDKAGVWKSKFDTGSNELKGLVYANQELYGIAPVISGTLIDVKSWSFYTNDQRGKIFDEYVNSEFTVISNEEKGVDKIFDVIVLDSKDRVDLMDVLIEDEVSFSPVQRATGIDAFKKGRDGKFFVNRIRNDVNNSRLRGQSAIERIVIINDSANNREVRITAILNKYRISARNL